MKYDFLIDTYETERVKVLSVWSEFNDDDLPVRPLRTDPRGRSVQEQMVHQCVSEDAWFRTMLGIDAHDGWLATPARARELAERVVHQAGTGRVALTRREILGPREHGWSAVLYDRETETFAQSRRHCVQVVDRVGGGDSFAAALIARLLSGDEPIDALEFAVTASALKLTVPGDFSRATVGEVVELLRP
jgi:2-dehydro-3-deoxygluconokinase